LTLLAFNSGCATTPVSTGVVTTTGILSDQTVNTTQKALLAIGSLLEATPGTTQALLDAGKITKDDYNKIVPVYNKVLVSWKAAKAVLKVGATADSYNAAFSAFLADKAEFDALLAQFGIGGTK
jgi:hypothetical protein